MKTIPSLALAFLAVLFCVGAEGADAPMKPNIVFIMADDLGYVDVGCYGQKLIQTPNIDKLAAEGIRFTQAYAGSTVCAPSRCALMTGLHMGHAHVRGNAKTNSLRDGDVTVAEVLKGAGYRTGLIGKWGLGDVGSSGVPPKQGWDYSFGYLDQVHAHTYWTDHLIRNGQRVEIPAKTYSHDLFTEEALQFIRREKDGPFFLYLAYTIPHQKFDPPSEAPYAEREWTPVQRKLAAMVTRMDGDVGRIMELLKELKIDENTLVFFTSDNGPRAQGADFFDSSGPLRGVKRDLYEGGIRVPMIARWPGKVKAGTTSDLAWAHWDVLPTLAEAAGAKVPAGLDGISVLPALLGKEQKGHAFLYWEFFERGFQQAGRMGDWKAVRLAAGKPLELYNLKEDVGEKKDVAGEHPEVVKEMEARLKGARVDHPDWPTDRKRPGAR